MSPFLKQLIDDGTLYTCLYEASKNYKGYEILFNQSLQTLFQWSMTFNASYWANLCNKYNDPEFTAEDAEYIQTSYPELFI